MNKLQREQQQKIKPMRKILAGHKVKIRLTAGKKVFLKLVNINFDCIVGAWE